MQAEAPSELQAEEEERAALAATAARAAKAALAEAQRKCARSP